MDTLITLDCPAKPDFYIRPFTFDDTEITIDAVTDAAKAFFSEKFGLGCNGITVTKSGAMKLEDQIIKRGLSF